MSERTETYQLPFEKGGFNANPNTDLISPISFVSESKNINMQNGGREKRGGTYREYVLPSSSSEVRGVHDFQLESGTQFKVTATSDGKIYKNATTTIKASGWSTTTKTWFMTLRDTLYATDGVHVPQMWDGAAGTTSDMVLIPADWTGTNFPAMMFTHSNGASFRSIAVGVPNFLDTAYISATNDGTDYSDANGVRVIIPTNNAFGLVTGAEFGKRAILFGKRKAYILNDLDPVVANWGYEAAQWEGGVASPWLLVKTPNDLIAMMEDGEIYSVLAVQEYGDYQAASISRPSFIHTWIKQNVDLANISLFHAVYDPIIRAIKFFVKLNGHSYVDTALVYYVDRTPTEAWSIHDNQYVVSGYRSVSSCVVRIAAGDEQVYTGGYAGDVWSLEKTTKSDIGSAANGYFFVSRTPHLNFEQARHMKLFIGGRLTVVVRGDFQLLVRWIVDGVEQTPVLVSPSSIGGFYGSALYGFSIYGSEEILDVLFELGQIGKRIQLHFENGIPAEDFFLSAGYIDFKWIGKMPQ